LLRGLWREVFGAEPEPVPAYTPDWSEPSGSEDLLAAAGRHLTAVPVHEARSGDVVVLRMRGGGVAKHVGILARSPLGHRTLIHAYSGHGVVESPLTPAWARRIAAAFRFPDRSA
jgi:NlpC/P60 family putative phage cell wall peptidase